MVDWLLMTAILALHCISHVSILSMLFAKSHMYTYSEEIKLQIKISALKFISIHHFLTLWNFKVIPLLSNKND